MARDQRAASQMAFHGLTVDASKRLLARDYGSLLAGIAANPAATVAHIGPIARYLSDSSAIVRTAHGLRLETSTVPLRVADGGKKRPVDLELSTDSGEAFHPRQPLTPLSIARESRGGVTVGTSGLRVTLRGTSVRGSATSDRKSVLYPGVEPDVDAAVTPTLDGAELSAVLRSRLSPEQLRYRVALPRATKLEGTDDGAVISRDEKPIARISEPSARDAQGSVVPVTMHLVGTELVLHVSDHDRSVAYPVLVDPAIVNITNSTSGWVFHKWPGCVYEKEEVHPLQPPINGTDTAGGPLAISVTSVKFPYKWKTPCQNSPEAGAIFGTWIWGSLLLKAPASIQFDGVALTYSALTEKPGEVVYAGFAVCGNPDGARYGGGLYAEELPPPTIEIETLECGAEKQVEVELGVGEFGVTTGAMSASLSVAAVLSSAPWAPVEEGETYGQHSKSEPHRKYCMRGRPVNCATGNQTETQTDLTVKGRGPGLNVARTYNSALAAKMSTHGPFGFGWTGPYSAHLETGTRCTGETCAEYATVTQDNGSTVVFEKNGTAWTPVGPLVESVLTSEAGSYNYTLPDQSTLSFNSEGKLTSEADRDGNAIALAYTEGRLHTATDGSGRKLTFAYNSEGEVESITDPLSHVVKYGYEAGNLKSVTEPGEATHRWAFEYDASHEMTAMTDGRGHTVKTEYKAGRVSSQTDALGRKREWEYESEGSLSRTRITEPTGAVTRETFNAQDLPLEVTEGIGTSLEKTTTDRYGLSDELISVTDPDGHKTSYTYNANGDRIGEKDANGNETTWTYDSKHDIETITTPTKETTTIKRDARGNPESVSRPAPGEKTQTTKYKYNVHGELESMTDPLERTWKYEYDTYGDRKLETDPEGNKRSWEYNEDSQETATVSPRGHVKAGEEAKYTTKIERDAQGRPITITDPLGHKTKYSYDGDGNTETLTDPNGNKAKYSYDADDEQIKIEEPKGTTTETEYDAEGQVIAQTDGNKHTTKYERNALERVIAVVDPKGRSTRKEYDLAGNLIKVTDPAERVTIYTYDPGNRLKEVTYSDGVTAAVKYEYNKDGCVTVVKDGSGTTKYTYDQLDRLTESENGHKEVIKTEYDLASEQTKLTYPNGKAVVRTYDKDGRLEKVTDWLSHATKFVYDPDSELTTTTFPSETKDEDKYTYNEADQTSEVKVLRGTESLASLLYTRDSDGQVKTVTSKGLPGEEKPSYEYDTNRRLSKGGTTAYEYDAGNNPTKLGSSTYKYDSSDELESGTGVTYTYNEIGQRTKSAPTTGAATTYGYDQAGNLITVERPKEGTKAAIVDSYAYTGNGLWASQTVAGTTSYLAWDVDESLPLLLSDGTSSYIYGPNNMPLEQVNNSSGTVLYVHHDQQGSTRLLTGSTGKTEGSYSYSPNGTPEHSGTGTTPLGFDEQYTSADTGLIYMRNRVYDPTTAQFVTGDPAVGITRAPYNYAGDNPVNRVDPTGLSAEGVEGVPCYWPLCGPPPPVVEGAQHGVETVEHGIESAWNAINENEGPTDEGEAELREIEARRARACGEPNPGNLEKVGDGEIKRILEEEGTDPHTDKAETVGGDAGRYDYYRDKTTGEIYLAPKGGGEPIPTGLG